MQKFGEERTWIHITITRQVVIARICFRQINIDYAYHGLFNAPSEVSFAEVFDINY